MIFEVVFFVSHAFLMFVLGLFPALPPISNFSAVESGLNAVVNMFSLAIAFFTIFFGDTITYALFFVIFATLTFETAYKFVMFVVRKIPMLAIR